MSQVLSQTNCVWLLVGHNDVVDTSRIIFEGVTPLHLYPAQRKMSGMYCGCPARRYRSSHSPLLRIGTSSSRSTGDREPSALELSTNLCEVSQCPEKDLPGAFSLLKAPTSAFTKHYAKWLFKHGKQMSNW